MTGVIGTILTVALIGSLPMVYSFCTERKSRAYGVKFTSAIYYFPASRLLHAVCGFLFLFAVAITVSDMSHLDWVFFTLPISMILGGTAVACYITTRKNFVRITPEQITVKVWSEIEVIDRSKIVGANVLKPGYIEISTSVGKKFYIPIIFKDCAMILARIFHEG